MVNAKGVSRTTHWEISHDHGAGALSFPHSLTICESSLRFPARASARQGNAACDFVSTMFDRSNGT